MISVVDSVLVTLLEFLQVLQLLQLQLQDGDPVGEAVGADEGCGLGTAVGLWVFGEDEWTKGLAVGVPVGVGVWQSATSGVKP